MKFSRQTNILVSPVEVNRANVSKISHQRNVSNPQSRINNILSLSFNKKTPKRVFRTFEKPCPESTRVRLPTTLSGGSWCSREVTPQYEATPAALKGLADGDWFRNGDHSVVFPFLLPGLTLLLFVDDTKQRPKENGLWHKFS